MIDLLCVGDVAVDIYEDRLYPGGCSLNIIRHLAQLCGQTPAHIGIMAPVGQDHERTIVEGSLQDTQVNEHLITTPYNTTRCYIDVDEHGERSFPKYEAQGLEEHRFDGSQQQVFAQYQHIQTLISKEGEMMLRSLLDLKLPHSTFCDFSDLTDFNDSADIVREFIDQLSIVFCGLEESQEGLIRDLQALSTEFQKIVIVTLGSKGCVGFIRGEEVSQPGFRVSSVVDTTGAGDSFIAAFLHQYLQQSDIRTCMTKANQYAARTIQYEGAFQLS